MTDRPRSQGMKVHSALLLFISPVKSLLISELEGRGGRVQPETLSIIPSWLPPSKYPGIENGGHQIPYINNNLLLQEVVHAKCGMLTAQASLDMMMC